LYAAGEVACTGVHGANRLASNSLLEGLVFGARASLAMIRRHPPARRERRAAAEPAVPPVMAERLFDGRPDEMVRDLQDVMWRRVGLFRDRKGLDEAARAFDGPWQQLASVPDNAMPADRATARAGSVVTVGRLMARAALRREESRGTHFRTDFPERDDLDWRVHVSESVDGAAPAPALTSEADNPG
jgi:L-aspartate oxidase